MAPEPFRLDNVVHGRPKAEQNGCRERLEGYLSCQQRSPLALA